MAIHTFHADEAKHEFFGGMPESETAKGEWAEGWSFENVGAWQLGREKTIYFFANGKQKAKRILFSHSLKKGWMNSSSCCLLNANAH